MQFALGSVLKLTRSAFGGLGSFRAPSIRRALPVLLGGLLCAVVSPAMAQSIESISLTSTPTGGPTGSPNTVYVIGDTITFTIDYDANLLVAPGSPTLRFKIGAQSRTANCAGQANTSRLLCSYVVKEGDEDNQDNNITVDGGVQLVGGNVPDRSPGGLTGGRPNKVDGSRLKLNDITASGVVNSYGFNAGSTITLMLQFGDGTALEPDMSNTGAMGATLVLENAERSARYVDTNGGTVRFNYAVVAGDNGAFGLKLTGVDALADKNGNQGLATGWESTVARELAGMDVTQRRVDTRGPRLTQILFRGVGGALVGRDDPTPDVPSKPVSDGSVVFDVFFDEPIEAVNATLRVTVGQTTFSTAACTGTDTFDSEWMRCNLQVGAASGWLDTDGLSTPSNPLNYTTLRDALGNPATPAFAPQRFPDIKVDSVPPTVTSATIRVPRAEINSNVIVRVTFSEDVDVTGTPEAAISFTNNLGGSQDDVAGNAVYSSVSGRVVEFRAPISSLPERTTTTTSIIAKLASVGEGIVDMAGNPAGVPDVDDTAASKTGVTITLRATPTDGELGDQYADKTAPTLERISLGGEVKKVYGLDDATPIQFDVLFSEPVTATDASLDLRIGTSPKPAELTAVTDNGARFTAIYDPVSGDTGTVAVSGIKLDAGGKIEDLNGRGWENANCAVKQAEEREDCRDDLSNSNRKDASKISKSLTGSARVDTTRPKVKSVTLLTTPAPGAVGNDRQRYYGAGETVRIQVTMDEDVVVPAGAEIVIGVRVTGAVSDQASFKLLRGKRDLIFEYKVAATDCSSGVSENCHIALNGIGVTGFVGPHASIKDVGGNACEASGSDGTCGYTWPSAPSGNHGVDARLSGDQKLTPLEETTTPGVQTVPVSTTTVVRSTTPTGGYYQAGDTITIEVSLSPAVTFTSAPQLLVNFDEGGSQRLTPGERISSSGTPTTRLTYSYQVASGDEDLDGFTASLSGGGTPTVEDGRRATLGSVSVRGIRIDALAPELEPPLRITSRARSGSTYVAGEEIEVTATFSEAVKRTSLGEEPKLTILIGGEERAATQQSPSSTAANDEYVFGYTVVAGDNGDVTIAANALESSLEDAAGNAASDSHPALSASTSHRVDTQAPSVTDVKVTGSGDDTLFLEGDTITATVTFDEEVEVETRGSDAVRVRFNIGTEQRTATYAGGDGTETLTFTYDVEAGDTGQISLPADALEGEVEDAAGNEAEGTLALSGGPYTVDASAPMLVGAPSITSSPPNGGDTYAEGQTITLQVRFDEPVMVTGEPRLPIQVGPRPRNIVLYTSGSGTDTLTFSYTVRNGDTDDDGVSVDANALRLPAGAAIADVNGLTAAIEHDPLPDQPGHKVDAIAPGIESVAITSTPASDDAYLIDETIAVTVTFSEDIATDGTPTLDLMVGEGVRAAACAQGGASTQLTCSYMVVANDFDPDGISVDADMLKGTITDMVGNPATLTHEALEDDPAHKVYAAAPEAVRTIDRLSLAAGGGTNSLDLTGIFTGFQLSYAAVSSNESVATATVSGTDLTVVSGMEGTARVTVTASNLAGEASVSFDVLVATDPAETAVLNDALAAIGRSMLSSTASVIGSRFELASTGSQMALGGSRFGGSLSPQMQRFLAGNDPFALEERMSERALFSGSGSQQAYGGGYGLTSDRLLTGTSFNMPLNAMGTGDAQFAVWGAGDLQSFEGEPDDGMYDGSSSSGYIGVDARGDGWLAGVSVSRSGAEADYDFDGLVEGRNTGGTLETSVTAFHPYARLEVGADSEVWVIGGFGGGEADLSRTHVTGSQSSDLSMAMAVGGLRRALAMEFGGADLSLRGDAGFLSLETDSGAMAVDGLSASVSRLRLGLEAAWEGESATPFVEVSGRFDGGDGQTGGGLELAGGLRILNPESGFGLEAKGRILAMHTGDGYSESGIGVTASFEPGAAGRGITFRLSPRWGGSADSTDLFWDEVGNVRDASQYAYGLDRAQTWGVDAALGYGFGLRSMPGVVTPFGQMDVTGDQDQRIRVGVRYGLMQGLLGGTQVELSAERVDGEMHRIGETRVLVSGRARF